MSSRVSAVLACLILSASVVSAAESNFSIRCGDCNEDGVVSVLDALVASQISLHRLTPTAAQLEACDVDVTTRGEVEIIDVLDVFMLARMSTASAPLPRCGLVNTVGVPSVTVTQRPYGSDFNVVAPDFSIPGATRFFDVEFLNHTSQIIIRVQNQAPGAIANLYVGLPGTLPGSRNASEYYFKSTVGGSGVRLVSLACSALRAHAGQLAVAVHSVVPGAFTLSVSPAVTACAETGGAPELSANGTPVAGRLGCVDDADYWQIASVPENANELVVTLLGPAPPSRADYDLMIGVPGTEGGDTAVLNYHGAYPYGAGGWGDPFASEVYVFSQQELTAYRGRQIAIGVIVRIPSTTSGDYTLRMETR